MKRTFPPFPPAVLTVILAGCLLCLSAGCGRTPNGEESAATISEHFGKAEFFYDQGDYQRAAEMYLKALVINPENSEACLKLGLIYDDNLKDKKRAAFYYQECLRLEPDTERAPLVRGWLEDALAEGTVPAVPAPDRSQSARRPDREETSPPPAASPIPTPVPSPQPAGRAATASYTVSGGDTLAGIARKLYGDPNAWKRIFEANRDQLESPHALRVGQELKIPR